MAEDFFRVQVGDFICTIISDGTRITPTDALKDLFTNVMPDEVVSAVARSGYNQETVTDDMNCMVIHSGDINILVDTGMGDKGQSTHGNLVKRLAAAKFKPEDINIVYISHFHIDHVAGLTQGPDNRPVFPNARYVTNQTEWDAWMNEESLSRMDPNRAAFYRSTLNSLRDQFTFVQPDDEIIGGVRVLEAYGHSPGHTGLLIHSRGEQLFALVDVLHKFIQFENPGFHHKFDSDANIAAATRSRLLQRAADEKLLTLIYHLPFPGLGYVSKLPSGAFEWMPIDTG